MTNKFFLSLTEARQPKNIWESLDSENIENQHWIVFLCYRVLWKPSFPPCLLFSFSPFVSQTVFHRSKCNGACGMKTCSATNKTQAHYWRASETQPLPSASSGGMTPSLAEQLFLALPDFSETPGKTVCNVGTFPVSRSVTLTSEPFPPASQKRWISPTAPASPTAGARPFLFTRGDILVPKLSHASNHESQEKGCSVSLDEQRRNSDRVEGQIPALSHAACLSCCKH